MQQAVIVAEAAKSAPSIIDAQTRTLKFVALGAVIIVGGVVAWKLGKSLIAQIQQGISEDLGGGLSDLTKTQAKDGSTQPNVGTTQIISIANLQESAMSGIGADFSSMYNSLSSLNGKALQYVAQKFGKRPLGLVFKEDTDLFGWYRDELSGNQLMQMRSLWNKSGIVF